MEEPTSRTSDRIYKTVYEVKKNENKGEKIKIELFMTYLKPVIVDYTDGTKDPEDCWTRIGVEKILKMTKYAKINLGERKKKITKISSEREALSRVYEKKVLELDYDIEAIKNFKNSSIQLGDQFQGSIKENSGKNNNRKKITKKKLNHISKE
ncbi:hypothetical protein F8M41_001477 [Gigaspora margarita]|uniref:Uncharacterized protein n=1 Tax=Gigaspora margarita TaxID=4874 RepID=A0A8H4A7T2_GIGMA|nr:hypothetical protein F8M41_001477 [Gigaspora margarita]